MTKNYATVSYPYVSIEIHTETASYKITNDIGTNITSVSNTALQNDIVSLRSTNSLSADSSTCAIMLAGDVRWDKVIGINDIIVVRMESNDPGKAAKNSNVFTGLVSAVAQQASYGSDSLMYQVTAQSFAKIFMSYGIGVIDQVGVQLSTMGWLWDSTAATATSSDSDDSDDSGSSSASITGSNNAEKIWNYMKDSGFTDMATAGVMGQMYAESGLNPASGNATEKAGKGNPYANGEDSYGIGLLQWTGPLHKELVKATNGNWKDLKTQMKVTVDKLKSDGLKKKLNAQKSISNAVATIYYSTMGVGIYSYDPYANNPRESFVARVSYANKYYKKFKGSKSTGSSDDDTSTDDTSTDDTSSSSSSSGSSDPSASAADAEKSSSIGVPFFGSYVAKIENALVDRFKPYINYHYDNGTKSVWDFLDYSNMQSWQDYEYLMDSSSFVNASGTLYELQKAVLRDVFTEMFYESLPNGKSHLVVRRTPFNPDDWSQLDSFTITSGDLIEFSPTKTDAQQCSVFVVNPDNNSFIGIQNGALVGAYPQWAQELGDYYGYTRKEVTDKYLSGKGSNAEDKAKKSTNNSKGTAYTYAKVVAYFNSLDKTDLRQKKAATAAALADKANNISAQQATFLVQSYVDNGYILTQQDYEYDMDSQNGGGSANTGTHDLSYDKMEELIEKSKGSVSTFVSTAAAYFKNVSHEFLINMYTSTGTSGKLTKKKYKAIVKEDRGEANTATAGSADDVKYFTQMMFNWYADNRNFWAGDAKIHGNPDVRVGSRLDAIDNLQLEANQYPGMRAYIESVTQEFSFTGGWTTTIGFTRGMRLPASNETDPRFTNMWGKSTDFLGGYMGEPSYASLAVASSSATDADDDSSSSSSSTSSAGDKKVGNITWSTTDNTYPKGQCTWWAKARSRWAHNYWGNGNMWAASARKSGFTVDHNPAKGTIISFMAGQLVGTWHANATYGHVAYVEAYDSEKNTITISQGGTGCKQQPGPNLQTLTASRSFYYIHPK